MAELGRNTSAKVLRGKPAAYLPVRRPRWIVRVCERLVFLFLQQRPAHDFR
jgi:hypothetical protein